MVLLCSIGCAFAQDNETLDDVAGVSQEVEEISEVHEIHDNLTSTLKTLTMKLAKLGMKMDMI